MEKSQISKEVLALVRRCQQNEVDEYHIYHNIAATVRDSGDRKTLMEIGDAERTHGKYWGMYTNEDPAPNRGKVLWLTLLAKLFGYTFVLKKMESGESNAAETYRRIAAEIPAAAQIAREEQEHEASLIEMLDEERLQYVGSMVLGMNDALVELTGTLAGLSFALQNNRLVALSGLITGVSATFSMTASAYLSAKSDNDPNAVKSCAYTGIMYLITVILLVLPFLCFPAAAYLPAVIAMLCTMTLTILVFNYYIAVAKGYSFKQRFWEMFGISSSVAALSFVVGLVVKAWLGIDL